MTIPNIFWKYYDLFRRKQLSLEEFSEKAGLEKDTILLYLQKISNETQ